MDCYCCSGRKFEDCCAPFLGGTAKPATAEELMRSRFSAYAAGEIEYLLRSTHPSTRKFYKSEELERWARANRWEKLEIVAKTAGEAADKTGTVEFAAHYRDENGEPHVHREDSRFRKELGKWFFVDGRIL